MTSHHINLERTLLMRATFNDSHVRSAMQDADLSIDDLSSTVARDALSAVFEANGDYGWAICLLQGKDAAQAMLIESVRDASCLPLLDIACEQLVKAKEDRDAHHAAGEFSRMRQGMSAAEVADLADSVVVSPIRDKKPARHGDIREVVARRLAGEPPARHVCNWGTSALDAMLGGIRATKQYVVGGRPGQGKTAKAIQATIQCLRGGGGVLFACVEMGEQELLDRLVANDARVPFGALHNDRVREADRLAVESSMAWLSEQKLRMMCGPTTIEKVCAQAASLHGKWGGIELVVVDYAQNLWVEDKALKRYQQLGVISRKLKNIAKPLDCATMLLSQLRRDQGKPKMSDLKESGDIEQEADCIVLIHREQPDRPETELMIPKCRFARTGMVIANFEGEYMSWG